MPVEQQSGPTSIPTSIPSKTSVRRKRWLIGLTAIFIIVGIGFLIYWLLIGRFYESTDDAYVNGNTVQVMSQITGQVVKIYADETDLVKKGEPLVMLDNADAEIALRNAEAQLALTARQVSELYQNVDQLKANVQLQQDNFIKAQQDYERRRGLVVNKVISEEDLSHAKTAVDTTADSLALAKHQLDAAVNLVQNTDLYNHPQIKQAEVNLRNAYLTWERTTIFSSVTGYVAKRPVQVGQQVDPNTILMIIVPLNQLWVDANFKESQLKNFRIGQPVELVSDLYGSSIKYHGTVIGLSPGTGSAFDLLPPQNATGNWIKIVQRLPVRIAIDSNELEKYPLRIGLSITATVDTHNRSGQMLTKLTSTKAIYESKDYGSDLQKSDDIINKILEDNAKNTTLSATPATQ